MDFRREKEAGKQRGTLEGGRVPWVLQISAWREEGAPEGGGDSGGRRGPRGRRGPSRKEGALEGRGNPWRVEVLVQSVDGGPQRDERDSRGWSPGGGGSWRAEGGPGEWRGSLRAEGGPKSGGLDLGPQEILQGQVDMETPGSSLLCNPAEPPPGPSPPSHVHRTHPGRVHPKDKKALEDQRAPRCRGLSQGPQIIPGWGDAE